MLDSFLEDSDEVVVLRVIEPTSSAQTGFDAITKEARSEAERVLDYLMKKNGDERQVRPPSGPPYVPVTDDRPPPPPPPGSLPLPKISLIVEFAIGPIEETIHR